MADGGEFGYVDPELDKKLDNDDDDDDDEEEEEEVEAHRTQPTEAEEAHRTQPLKPNDASTPYHGVNKLKCKLCSTSNQACLTLLLMKIPL